MRGNLCLPDLMSLSSNHDPITVQLFSIMKHSSRSMMKTCSSSRCSFLKVDGDCHEHLYEEVPLSCWHSPNERTRSGRKGAVSIERGRRPSSPAICLVFLLINSGLTPIFTRCRWHGAGSRPASRIPGLTHGSPPGQPEAPSHDRVPLSSAVHRDTSDHRV